jgi:serine/threonine protein kinase
MGRVFRARDIDLERDVAIKILTCPLHRATRRWDGSGEEARLLAQVRHDHIVRVHETGVTRDGLPYFVMDLVDGVALSTILGRLNGARAGDLAAGDLDWIRGANRSGGSEEAHTWRRSCACCCRSRTHWPAAHRAGVIHRDVKPGNILVDRSGRAHLVDFGIAREADSASLSATGHLAGTPTYMAPEQISASGSAVSPATDVYGLGITLYEALTLSKPFEADSVAKVYWSILNEQPRRPSAVNPAIARDLENDLPRSDRETPGRSLLPSRRARGRPAGGARPARDQPTPAALARTPGTSGATTALAGDGGSGGDPGVGCVTYAGLASKREEIKRQDVEGLIERTQRGQRHAHDHGASADMLPVEHVVAPGQTR